MGSNREYVERGEAPKVRDRLRSNPAVIVVPGWSISAGIVSLWSAYNGSLVLSESIARSPTWMGIWIGAALIVAGISALCAICIPTDKLGWQWRLERSSWTGLAVTWLAYGILIHSQFPHSFLSWGSAITFFVISTARWLAVVKTEAVTSHVVLKARGDS